MGTVASDANHCALRLAALTEEQILLFAGRRTGAYGFEAIAEFLRNYMKEFHAFVPSELLKHTADRGARRIIVMENGP